MTELLLKVNMSRRAAVRRLFQAQEIEADARRHVPFAAVSVEWRRRVPELRAGESVRDEGRFEPDRHDSSGAVEWRDEETDRRQDRPRQRFRKTFARHAEEAGAGAEVDFGRHAVVIHP